MTTGLATRARRRTARWAGLVLALLFLQPAVGQQRLERARQVLGQEMRYQPLDKFHLREREPCPAWIDGVDEAEGACRRLDTVYGNVYLSGILVQHGQPADTLLIYHAGHEAARPVVSALARTPVELVNTDAAWLIGKLFELPADVLILTMPGLGLDPAEETEPVRRMYSAVSNHSAFALIDSAGDSAATSFTAHVKGFIDRHGRQYRRIVMVGRSGGGWATTLAAAAEPRINCSISFFGTLPMQLRLPVEGDGTDDLGDFEQYGLQLYHRLDYLDLYALASAKGRIHTQVYNEEDDCCFSGAVKGKRVETLFEQSYPNHRGFSVVILPKRSEQDHYNLDQHALSTITRQCRLQAGE